MDKNGDKKFDAHSATGQSISILSIVQELGVASS